MQYIMLLICLLACSLLKAGDDDDNNEFWGPSTSGPFFTSTAEASRPGSYMVEPWYYGFIQGKNTTNTFYQSFYTGLGKNWNLMVQEPWVMQNNGQSGLGTTYIDLRKTVYRDQNTLKLWAFPSVAFDVTDNLPTGTYGTQTNVISFQSIFHKRFRPFELYWQVGDAPVSAMQTTTGQIYNYSIAFEHVLNSDTGLGYLIEFYGQSQFGAGGFSYLWGTPEAEINLYTSSNFSINFGVGVGLPVYESNFPVSYVPMTTFTINFGKPAAQQR